MPLCPCRCRTVRGCQWAAPTASRAMGQADLPRAVEDRFEVCGERGEPVRRLGKGALDRVEGGGLERRRGVPMVRELDDVPPVKELDPHDLRRK